MVGKKAFVGTVQVYTGDGKGKTTAALGLALRAWGHGRRVLIIQFMKGQLKYGEVLATRRLKGITVEQYGRATFVDRGHPSSADRALAREGLARARAAVADPSYDLIVLDEINVACDFGLITVEEVMEVIRAKRPEAELVLTGRGAPPAVLAAADTVTEMREVKHHYQAGIAAREGVEY